MFYRRKYYVVKNEFVEVFNTHFNETNLPNQIEHGARLIGRWMMPINDDTTEIFAIWEYDSFENYKQIEIAVRSDSEHLKRIQHWYEQHGGREHVLTHYILEMRNEQIYSTIDELKFSTHNEKNDEHHQIEFWKVNKRS